MNISHIFSVPQNICLLLLLLLLFLLLLLLLQDDERVWEPYVFRICLCTPRIVSLQMSRQLGYQFNYKDGIISQDMIFWTQPFSSNSASVTKLVIESNKHTNSNIHPGLPHILEQSIFMALLSHSVSLSNLCEPFFLSAVFSPSFFTINCRKDIKIWNRMTKSFSK